MRLWILAEEDYKLLQLEAISPVAMTGEASRMLNTEGKSRRSSQAQVPSGPGKQIWEAGIEAEAKASSFVSHAQALPRETVRPINRWPGSSNPGTASNTCTTAPLPGNSKNTVLWKCARLCTRHNNGYTNGKSSVPAPKELVLFLERETLRDNTPSGNASQSGRNNNKLMS